MHKSSVSAPIPGSRPWCWITFGRLRFIIVSYKYSLCQSTCLEKKRTWTKLFYISWVNSVYSVHCWSNIVLLVIAFFGVILIKFIMRSFWGPKSYVFLFSSSRRVYLILIHYKKLFHKTDRIKQCNCVMFDHTWPFYIKT